MSNVIYYIEVEGVGTVVSSTPYTYRWCTRTPTSAAVPSRYVAGLDLPSAVQADVDWLEGRVSFSGLSCRIAASSTALTQFGRSYVGATTSTQSTWQVTDTTVTAADATSISVGDLAWCGRETLYVSSVAGDVLTVQRAVLSTVATVHSAYTGIHLGNPIARGRTVYLYRTDDSETTPTLLRVAVLEDITQTDTAALDLMCVGGEALLRGPVIREPWRAEIRGGFRGLAYTISGEVTTAPVSERTSGSIPSPYAGQMRQLDGDSQAVGAPWCALQLHDSSILVYRGSAGSRITVRPSEAPLEGDPIDLDTMSLGVVASEVLVTHDAEINPFRAYTIGDDYLPATRNPFEIALILMLSNGSAGLAAAGINYDGADTVSYSTLPAGVGLAVPRALVDLDAWEDAAADCMAVADRVHITAEDTGDDVLRKLLWPLGYVVVADADGLLKPVQLTDTVDTAAATAITSGYTDAEHEPTWSRQLGLIFGDGEIEWGDGGDPDTVLSDVAERWYSQYKDAAYRVDASYYSRARNRPAVRTSVVAAASQLSFPPPSIQITVSPDIAESVSLGSLVTLTHPSLTDSDGSLGLTAVGGYVVAETLDLAQAGAKDLTIWYTGHDLTRVGAIHWAVRVLGYAPATRVVTVQQDYWTATDTSYPQVGDALRLHECDGTARSTTSMQLVTVSAITSTTITLSADFINVSGATYPQPGDILVSASYLYATNDEPDTYIYLAGDDDGKVRSDDGYQVTR